MYTQNELLWQLDSEFQSLIKQQTALTNCKELSKLRYQEAVLLFDGMSARKNIPMLQFNIFPETTKLTIPTLIDQNQNLKDRVITTKPNGHPDETGHQMIAQLLINHIDHAIIAT